MPGQITGWVTDAQLVAQFGSGQETAAQLEGRQATAFGSGQDEVAMGCKRLKQTNPVFYTVHANIAGS